MPAFQRPYRGVFPVVTTIFHDDGTLDLSAYRALVLGTRSYTSVAAILKNRRERAPAAGAEPPLLIHENIRGPGYYH